MIGWLLRLSDRARNRALRRRTTAEQAAGRRGEDLAHRYLERKGLIVVARNWRPPGGQGEIDLVARDGEELVFIEVKSRHSDEYGAPDRNIDAVKRAALLRSGRSYARRARVEPGRLRFDLVTILLGDPPEIVHVRNAFPVSWT